MNTIGERLRLERERVGKNQTEFGAIGGVLKGAQINYEQDKRQPDAAYLSAIAESGADVLYILTGVRSTSVVSDLSYDEQALVGTYRMMAEETRATYKTIGSALAQSRSDEKVG
ncbi:XRE family Transcriptional regulator [Ferriphaselus amnicola]|uniref:XRE family Transcriptional regulator n=1 Tax=Ferriphaselus amnicola TaxID=1188319 RepID=A0A2Z6GCJ2_9PROT|nr:helix-turn-helix transcriptional regulator [Ferriphaselus amnicola]BBE51157.1 XRE family Transcriptional regulator [Ferriphaselus amnicola]